MRNWINDNGLPASNDPRGRTLDWPVTLKWYVSYQIAKIAGTGGNQRPGNGLDGPQETLDEAMLRKVCAEADLKELQLARERGQVAAIADVERVLTSANKSIQTRILAMPAALAPQLMGIEDRARINAILTRNCREVLTNLASVDAVLQSRTAQPESEEE